MPDQPTTANRDRLGMLIHRALRSHLLAADVALDLPRRERITQDLVDAFVPELAAAWGEGYAEARKEVTAEADQAYWRGHELGRRQHADPPTCEACQAPMTLTACLSCVTREALERGRAEGIAEGRRQATEGQLDRAVLVRLVRELVEQDECWFDHHGGCQAHGYLSLEPGEQCPHAEAKALVGPWEPAEQHDVDDHDCEVHGCDPDGCSVHPGVVLAEPASGGVTDEHRHDGDKAIGDLRDMFGRLKVEPAMPAGEVLFVSQRVEPECVARRCDHNHEVLARFDPMAAPPARRLHDPGALIEEPDLYEQGEAGTR